MNFTIEMTPELLTYIFDNGVRAHIFVSWLHPYKEQRLVVVGSEKMAVFDDRASNGEKLIVHDKGVDWIEQKPVPRQGDGRPVELEVTEPLKAEMEHFLSCIDTREQPLTDGANGLRVLEVLQASERSLEMGGNRIQLTPRTVSAPLR